MTHAIVLRLLREDTDRVVVAEVGDDATVRELASALAIDETLWSVDGPLDPDTTLIEAGVASGATLSAGRALALDWKQLGPELRVIGGTGAGLRRRLTDAAYVVGRSGDVVVTGERVSRRHAELQWTAKGFRVRDLGSRHGTYVEGDLLPANQWIECAPGTAVRLADSVLTVVASTEASAVRRHGGPFHIAHAGGRSEAVTVTTTHHLPAPLQSTDRRSLAPLVVPSAGAVALAAAAGGAPTGLALAATPAAVVVGLLADKGLSARAARRTKKQRLRQIDVVRSDLRRAASDLAAQLRHAHPDAASLLAAAERRTTKLWSVDAEALELRLGLATTPDAVALEASPTDRGELDDAAAAHLTPVTVPLAGAPLVVAGSESQLDELTTWLVIQAVALVSPADLDVVVLSDEPERWAWVAATPHATAPALLPTTVEPAALPPRAARRRLIVVDGDPGTTWFDARAVGDDLVVWRTRRLDTVPPFATTVVTAHGDGELAVDHAGRVQLGVLTDRLHDPSSTALTFGCLLAGLRAASATTHTQVSDVAALYPEVLDADALVRRWRDAPDGLRVAIGANVDGQTHVALVGQNSHLLVAGTTGSGKTRLLETLLVSLAANFSPDALRFMVIDFKGGNELAALSRLPHCAGFVSDREPNNVDRAIAALTREIARRDEQFASVGATDIDDYLAKSATGMARLVIVADEFGQFRRDDAMGDRVGALLRVAAQGRSKGVHLVLATQSPSTDVTPEIRQNVGVRMCLRVAEASESLAVLGVADAASLREPGDVLIAADGHLRRSRVALSRGIVATERPAIAVRDLQRFATEVPSRDVAGVELLDVVIDTIAKASAAMGSVAPPLLPPPLPERLVRNDLAGARAPWTQAGFVLGERDRPGTPGAAPFTFDAIRESTLTIVGGPESGRTTALLALAESARVQRDPSHPLVVHAIDWTGGLASLRGAGLDGGVVERGDFDHLRRILHALATPTDRYRLLLIDRYDAVLRDVRELDGGQLTIALAELIASARQRRLFVALTTDPSALVGNATNFAGGRLVLPIGDASMRIAAGLGAASVSVPGRAVAGGDEVQLGLPADEPARAAAPAPGHVAPMPARIPVARLGFTNGERFLLGVGGRGVLEPVAIDVDEAGPLLAVIGRRGSGRSTALDAVATTYAGARAVVRIGDRPHDWTPSASPTLVLVDDTTRAAVANPWLNSATLEDDLRAGGHAMVAVFDQADLTALGYSHWLTRRPCSGLLLSLDATADRIMAGERLGFQPPADLRAGPAGRGWWCHRGVGTPVQVAEI